MLAGAGRCQAGCKACAPLAGRCAHVAGAQTLISRIGRVQVVAGCRRQVVRTILKTPPQRRAATIAEQYHAPSLVNQCPPKCRMWLRCTKCNEAMLDLVQLWKMYLRVCIHRSLTYIMHSRCYTGLRFLQGMQHHTAQWAVALSHRACIQETQRDKESGKREVGPAADMALSLS